jgi:hypothetical protein
MEDRQPPPPYFGDYPDGGYFAAEGPEPDQRPDPYTVKGSDIRVMWDEGAGPLWG